MRPVPIPTSVTRRYWDSVNEEALRIPKCRTCGAVHFYPHALCPNCMSPDLDYVPVSGNGTVYSYTIMHRAPATSFQHDIPYAVALVELEEGVRMISNLVGCPIEEVRIGMPVRAVYEDVTPEVTLFKFTPA